jgi:hypothetical protein
MLKTPSQTVWRTLRDAFFFYLADLIKVGKSQDLLG